MVVLRWLEAHRREGRCGDAGRRALLDVNPLEPGGRFICRREITGLPEPLGQGPRPMSRRANVDHQARHAVCLGAIERDRRDPAFGADLRVGREGDVDLRLRAQEGERGRELKTVDGRQRARAEDLGRSREAQLEGLGLFLALVDDVAQLGGQTRRQLDELDPHPDVRVRQDAPVGDATAESQRPARKRDVAQNRRSDRARRGGGRVDENSHR